MRRFFFFALLLVTMAIMVAAISLNVVDKGWLMGTGTVLISGILAIGVAVSILLTIGRTRDPWSKAAIGLIAVIVGLLVFSNTLTLLATTIASLGGFEVKLLVAAPTDNLLTHIYNSIVSVGGPLTILLPAGGSLIYAAFLTLVALKIPAINNHKFVVGLLIALMASAIHVIGIQSVTMPAWAGQVGNQLILIGAINFLGSLALYHVMNYNIPTQA